MTNYTANIIPGVLAGNLPKTNILTNVDYSKNKIKNKKLCGMSETDDSHLQGKFAFFIV